MPTYEYQCSACGHAFEVFQKMSDAPIKDCPNCKMNEVRKLVSAANFQLKGTGWYVTDFRDKGKVQPKEQENSEKKPEPEVKTKEKVDTPTESNKAQGSAKDTTE